jgi:hypothetical protein
MTCLCFLAVAASPFPARADEAAVVLLSKLGRRILFSLKVEANRMSAASKPRR